MKPRQKKSRTYYYFWGIATIAVVTGQIYVGNGFRRMADTADAISADINLLIETMLYRRPTTGPRYQPMPSPSPEDQPDYPIIR